MKHGIYEKPIISALQNYFINKGYQVKAHAQINIAWSNIISDVDLLAINNDEVVAIEVKSKKDVFRKAFIQLDKVAPFVDKTYVATDDEVKANEFGKQKSEYGIIYVDLIYGTISIKKRAKKCKRIASIADLCYLRRCCLQEIATKFNIATHQQKPYVAFDIRKASNPLQLKNVLKEIVIHEKYNHPHKPSTQL